MRRDMSEIKFYEVQAPLLFRTKKHAVEYMKSSNYWFGRATAVKVREFYEVIE